DHAADPAWMSNADRVADRHFESAHVHERFGNGGDARRRHFTFERTAESGRHVPAHSNVQLGGPRANGPVGVERSVDILIDVAQSACVSSPRDYVALVGAL